MRNSTFHARIRFNHGYHDAVSETQWGCPRQLSETIHDTEHVSPAFDPYYFEGYKAGLAETNYTGNSEAAWLVYRSTLPDEQLSQIHRDVISAYLATWKPREHTEYLLTEARKDADRICGKSF